MRADAFAASPVSEGLAYIADIVTRVFRGSPTDVAALPVPEARFYSHWTGAVLKLRGALLQTVDGGEFVNAVVERGERGKCRRERVRDRWGLTGREGEVLDLVADGKTNPEIGIILGVSRLTVKKHLESIFRALGVETRTAAAAVLLESKGL